MDLMCFGNNSQLVLLARYDNLGKGAAGAAVQNLNIMLGVEEENDYENSIQELLTNQLNALVSEWSDALQTKQAKLG